MLSPEQFFGFLLAALAGWGLVTVEPESIRLFASPEILQKVQQGELWTDGLLGVAPLPAIAESLSQVRIVHEAGRYRLLVDGQPYVVKGAGMADGGQETLAARGGVVWLPEDVVIADRFAADADTRICDADNVPAGWMILDIGLRSRDSLASVLARAGTIVWNGPVGVFEFDQFGNGTKVLAQAIAESPAFSIAGGGDTLAAIDKYGVGAQISYISTGGGAFLEFVEGKVLPAVEVLEQRANA